MRWLSPRRGALTRTLTLTLTRTLTLTLTLSQHHQAYICYDASNVVMEAQYAYDASSDTVLWLY